jgi:NADH-quinone oxidoreductase subunit C
VDTAMTKAERLATTRTRFEETVKSLRQKFGDTFTTSEFRDNFRVIVDAARTYDVLTALKADGFDALSELGGADYLHYPDAKDRYCVWYCLANTKTGQRIVVKTFANDPDPKLRSVYELWKGSDWMEREVYDMYGVEFVGHPVHAANPDARRVHVLPAAEGLPDARPGRAPQLPDDHASRKLKNGFLAKAQRAQRKTTKSVEKSSAFLALFAPLRETTLVEV